MIRSVVRALRFAQYGPPSVLFIAELETPKVDSGDALIQIHAAAINPSDVKNVAGAFHTPLPRTPGRDYAGTVVAGEGVGREVWGSGPGFGVERDGSHAEFVAVPVAWLADKPRNLSMLQAAAIGVPFVVVWNGLVQAAALSSGETVLIIGVFGAVGRAATQVAHWRGARVIGTDILRSGSPDSIADVFIDARANDFVARVRAATHDSGVDLVFDAVGGPMFEQGLNSLRPEGRQVTIASTAERRVSFDLVDFYHARLHLTGVDSLKLQGPEIATIMDALRPGFESGALRPFDVQAHALDEAVAAYSGVERGGIPSKQILVPAP